VGNTGSVFILQPTVHTPTAKHYMRRTKNTIFYLAVWTADSLWSKPEFQPCPKGRYTLSVKLGDFTV